MLPPAGLRLGARYPSSAESLSLHLQPTSSITLWLIADKLGLHYHERHSHHQSQQCGAIAAAVNFTMKKTARPYDPEMTYTIIGYLFLLLRQGRRSHPWTRIGVSAGLLISSVYLLADRLQCQFSVRAHLSAHAGVTEDGLFDSTHHMRQRATVQAWHCDLTC